MQFVRMTHLMIIAILTLFLSLVSVISAQQPGTVGIELEVFACDYWPEIHIADLVTFQHGIGLGTYEEAVSERAGHEAFFFIDGRLVRPVFYEGLVEHQADFYGDRARANWIATPGVHTVQSYWTHENEEYPGDTCTFEVSGKPRRPYQEE